MKISEQFGAQQQTNCDTDFQINKNSNKTTVALVKELSALIFKLSIECLFGLNGTVFRRLSNR